MPPLALPPAAPSLASLSFAVPVAVVTRADPAPYGWQLRGVRRGDTLGHLAIAHRTTVGALLARNRLRGGGHLLVVGQRLWVPRVTKAAARAAPAATPKSKSAGRNRAKVRAPATTTYTVRQGDTIGAIALRLRVAQSTLLSLNHLRSTEYIFPGQRLRVAAAVPRGPARSARPARAAAHKKAAVRYTTYVVRGGDSISAIAVRLRVSQAGLLKANRLSASSMIYVGQRIRVPSSSSSPASAHNTFAGRTYAPKIVSSAAANRRYLARVSVPGRLQTRARIIATARRHGVDQRLALAIAWQESGWNQRQVSVANAIGVMQVIPSSGVWASQLSGRRLNLLDTDDNITAGIVIIRSLLRSADSQEQAIAGYYQGLGSVRRNGMYADTKVYVRSILAHRTRM